jgi:MFS family permease
MDIGHWEFIVLGIPTWALVDGTWAALSQLVDRLPEGYDLSAYLILALTFGNLAPLLLGYFLRDKPGNVLLDVITVILGVGLLSGILMSAMWHMTVEFSTKFVSLPIFLLFFVVGACSSSSNVTHFTFVSTYDASNTTALSTGMGLGSMIAGLLGILQGLLLIHYGFSTSIYYAVLSALYIPALYVVHRLRNKEVGVVDATSKSHLLRGESCKEYSDKTFVTENISILFLQCMNSFLGYGVVPAIVSYSCGKFNNASLVLLLATGITAIVDPIAKASTLYYRLTTLRSLWTASLVLLFLCVGLLICASQPTNSPLYSGNGGILPVFIYISFGATFGFTNTCVFRLYKEIVDHNHVQHAYRWSGIASQSGAFVGSIVAFVVVITSAL